MNINTNLGKINASNDPNRSNMDCSLSGYVNEFGNQMHDCVRNNINLDDGCVGVAAGRALNNMQTQCKDHPSGNDCTPGGYLQAGFEALDHEKIATEVIANKIKKVAREEVIAAGAGCVLGGAIGGGVGAVATWEFAGVGGALGAVQGCEWGTPIALAAYNSSELVQGAAGLMGHASDAIEGVKQHSRSCSALPEREVKKFHMPKDRMCVASKDLSKIKSLKRSCTINKIEDKPTRQIQGVDTAKRLKSLESKKMNTNIQLPSASTWNPFSKDSRSVVDWSESEVRDNPMKAYLKFNNEFSVTDNPLGIDHGTSKAIDNFCNPIKAFNSSSSGSGYREASFGDIIKNPEKASAESSMRTFMDIARKK